MSNEILSRMTPPQLAVAEENLNALFRALCE
jgi:hypothetical protein